ncbi:hypothetical protein [Microbacterium paraoxydans]|uniref:hypothetical protein n=1 Tax=Microbacterium paraoxydans TaxID=199592 RepID=UPI001CFAE285|nr:hypothetical protein [Microbacterium paraoxydans]
MSQELGPISPDWTIDDLVVWLADDARQHDPALRPPLAAIETALSGESWTRAPATVALIRSLAALRREHGSSVIADILQLGYPAPVAETVAHRPTQRANLRREREPVGSGRLRRR